MTDSPGKWDPETQQLIDEAVEEEVARQVREAQATEAPRQPATFGELVARSRADIDTRRQHMTDQLLRRTP